MVKKICQECKKEFNARGDYRKFCSEKCMWTYRRKISEYKRRTITHRFCKRCNQTKPISEFPMQPYKGYKGKKTNILVPYGACRRCLSNYINEYYIKYPWRKKYNSARRRCIVNLSYKNRIKFLMTVEDFKILWFRDKAWLLKEPSIDRIDTYGNYELSNCRFIEFIDNMKRPRRLSIRKHI